MKAPLSKPVRIALLLVPTVVMIAVVTGQILQRQHLNRRLQTLEDQLDQLKRKIDRLPSKEDILDPKPRLLESARPTHRSQQRNPEDAEISFRDIDLREWLKVQKSTQATVDQLPAKVRQFAGSRIAIRGYMFPSFEESGISNFVLASDLDVTDFGRNPVVSDLIAVQVRRGAEARFTQREQICVSGRFALEPKYSDGNLVALYTLTDAVIVQ